MMPTARDFFHMGLGCLFGVVVGYVWCAWNEERKEK